MVRQQRIQYKTPKLGKMSTFKVYLMTTPRECKLMQQYCLTPWIPRTCSFFHLHLHNQISQTSIKVSVCTKQPISKRKYTCSCIHVHDESYLFYCETTKKTWMQIVSKQERYRGIDYIIGSYSGVEKICVLSSKSDC